MAIFVSPFGDLLPVTMARLLPFVVCVLMALLAISEAQKITNLPGWNPASPFNMYSGYIDLTEGKRYFYWYGIPCITFSLRTGIDFLPQVLYLVR